MRCCFQRIVLMCKLVISYHAINAIKSNAKCCFMLFVIYYNIYIENKIESTMTTNLVKHDFSKCILCQKSRPTQDKLVNPNHRTQKSGRCGYDVIESTLLNNAKNLPPNLNVLAATVSLRTYLAENSARYHKNCYNDLKKQQNETASISTAPANSSKYQVPKTRESFSQICDEDMVFAELCVHIQSFADVNGWSILLSDVCTLYNESARKYNLAMAHATRLKEKLLQNIPSLIEIKSGREVVLSHIKKTVIAKFSENDRAILRAAAKILRKDLFNRTGCENVLDDVDQEASFSAELLYFITLLLDGDEDTSNLHQPINQF